MKLCCFVSKHQILEFVFKEFQKFKEKKLLAKFLNSKKFQIKNNFYDNFHLGRLHAHEIVHKIKSSSTADWENVHMLAKASRPISKAKTKLSHAVDFPLGRAGL